jgi:hypothetical protein
MEEGKKHDATELLAGKKGETVNILVDSGLGDNLCVLSRHGSQGCLADAILSLPATRKANFCLKTSRKQPKMLDSETIKFK